MGFQCKVPEAPIHPTRMSECANTTPCLDWATPQTRKLGSVPRRPTGSARQRIPEFTGSFRTAWFLSNTYAPSVVEQIPPVPTRWTPSAFLVSPGVSIPFDLPIGRVQKMPGHRAPSWVSVARLPKVSRSLLALLSAARVPKGLPKDGWPVVARPCFRRHGFPKMPGPSSSTLSAGEGPGASSPKPGRATSLGVLAVKLPTKSHPARQSTIVRAMLHFEGGSPA